MYSPARGHPADAEIQSWPIHGMICARPNPAAESGWDTAIICMASPTLCPMKPYHKTGPWINHLYQYHKAEVLKAQEMAQQHGPRNGGSAPRYGGRQTPGPPAFGNPFHSPPAGHGIPSLSPAMTFPSGLGYGYGGLAQSQTPGAGFPPNPYVGPSSSGHSSSARRPRRASSLASASSDLSRRIGKSPSPFAAGENINNHNSTASWPQGFDQEWPSYTDVNFNL